MMSPKISFHLYRAKYGLSRNKLFMQQNTKITGEPENPPQTLLRKRTLPFLRVAVLLAKLSN
jgi:hypothetical protein